MIKKLIDILFDINFNKKILYQMNLIFSNLPDNIIALIIDFVPKYIDVYISDFYLGYFNVYTTIDLICKNYKLILYPKAKLYNPMLSCNEISLKHNHKLIDIINKNDTQVIIKFGGNRKLYEFNNDSYRHQYYEYLNYYDRFNNFFELN